MYALLSGCLPFFGNTPIEVFEKIKEAQVNFQYKEFRHISSSAKDLINKLLTKDYRLRYTCTDALLHPWFTEVNTNATLQNNINKSMLERLKNYTGVSALKREAMNVLVKMIDPNKIENLRQAFHEIDKD